ncbi:MAG: glycine--tRNA ligase subunit beta [Endomicrobia bacterium]|nr:glycine--tRNA ligase subunit beta [Endomicrobiia bacterium]
MKKDLLIEIYTEELPINCVSNFKAQLPFVIESVLEKFKIEYGDIKSYITPVRMIIYVKKISEQTKKEVYEILGPPVSVGLKNGEFTPQGVGFAKKYGVELKDVYIKETEKGKVLAVKKISGGEEVKNKISEVVKELIVGLAYPKMMVWEETRFKFPRPIRNIVVIFGNEFIKIKIASSVSTNFTYGIKTYPIKKLKIQREKNFSLVESYFNILKKECIIYDFDKRYQTLLKSIENICVRKKLKYDNDPKLLTEIVSIVEYPTCIECKFPEEFLNLPQEFIIICLKTKQKFIPLYTEQGEIVNEFIGVKNGSSEHLDIVRDGFEKVLIARLDDVAYYYNTDSKYEFDSYFEHLRGVVYNEKLDSSYYDKILRIKQLAGFLNEELNLNIDGKIIDITSKLIKNDLLTQIVYEYPELQGTAGRIYCSEYCKKHNLPQEIAFCCEEHYLPKFYEDKVPTHPLSILFSLSSKISDIIDMTITDNLPTGTSDVYGLKKTADSVIKICFDLKFDLCLSKIVKYYLEHPITRKTLLGQEVKWDYPFVIDTVIKFFIQRLENIFVNEAYNIDEIRSALADFNGEFFSKSLLLSSLKNFRSKPEFIKLIELYKRVNNILIQAKKKGFKYEDSVNTELLKLEQEKVLYDETQKLKVRISGFYSNKEFDKVIKIFIELKPIVDNFFDKVLVFDENITLAENRLKLLNSLLKVFRTIGALEYIQI